jgi:hypothetical protein
MRQPFLSTFSVGMVVAAALGLVPWHQDANLDQSDQREGDGVYVKTRCIQPSAHMPIVAFVPPSTYEKTSRTAASLDTAHAYSGVTEQPPGSNAGAAVERFLASVGLPGGYAWCAAYTSHALQQAGAGGPATPNGSVIKSAGTRDYLGATTLIEPRAVAQGRTSAPEGSLVVWSVRGSWRGHIGIVRTRWSGQCGQTIEGNTSRP